MIQELDRVKLRRPLPGGSVPRGAEGTVVLVYPDRRHFEVEFLDASGATLAVCTVPSQLVAAVEADEAQERTRRR